VSDPAFSISWAPNLAIRVFPARDIRARWNSTLCGPPHWQGFLSASATLVGAAKALHTQSAYATNARLTLAQLSVHQRTNEITAIPDLLDHIAEAKQLKRRAGHLDAMGCQVAIADKIVAHGADYLFGLKGNQATCKATSQSISTPRPKRSC
jgi:hypothetical protein